MNSPVRASTTTTANERTQTAQNGNEIKHLLARLTALLMCRRIDDLDRDSSEKRNWKFVLVRQNAIGISCDMQKYFCFVQMLIDDRHHRRCSFSLSDFDQMHTKSIQKFANKSFAFDRTERKQRKNFDAIDSNKWANEISSHQLIQWWMKANFLSFPSIFECTLFFSSRFLRFLQRRRRAEKKKR